MSIPGRPTDRHEQAAATTVFVLYYADEMDGSEWVRAIFSTREAAESAAADGEWIMETQVRDA